MNIEEIPIWGIPLPFVRINGQILENITIIMPCIYFLTLLLSACLQEYTTAIMVALTWFIEAALAILWQQTICFTKVTEK